MVAERKSQEQVLEVIKLLCKEKDIAVSHLNVTIVEKDRLVQQYKEMEEKHKLISTELAPIKA